MIKFIQLRQHGTFHFVFGFALTERKTKNIKNIKYRCEREL